MRASGGPSPQSSTPANDPTRNRSGKPVWAGTLATRRHGCQEYRGHRQPRQRQRLAQRHRAFRHERKHVGRWGIRSQSRITRQREQSPHGVHPGGSTTPPFAQRNVAKCRFHKAFRLSVAPTSSAKRKNPCVSVDRVSLRDKMIADVVSAR